MTVIDEHGGWFFAQRLSAKARVDSMAESAYCGILANDRFKAVLPPPNGLGFDATGMMACGHLREMISEAPRGRHAHVHLASWPTTCGMGVYNTPFRWQAVEYLESHDVIDFGHDDRQPRIPKAGRLQQSRILGMRQVDRGLRRASCLPPPVFRCSSWVRSFWKTSSGAIMRGASRPPDLLGRPRLEQDDERLFSVHERIDLASPASSGACGASGSMSFTLIEVDRIIAFHRWIDGIGASRGGHAASMSPRYGPMTSAFRSRPWLEVFNSDVYENWVNPWAAGNQGSVAANSEGRHTLPSSARIVIPANSILIFATDHGD